ncbi:MAG: hypothetical protein ACI9D0_000752 [Bacteroidia bacterium]|jgi:hypothetical protein
MDGNIFPAWTSTVRDLLPFALGGGGLFVATIVTFGFSPNTLSVGFSPEQPIPFSHKLHAGEMGMDCRYCHNTVELGAKAAVPATETCVNCHKGIHTESVALAPLRESAETGNPIAWNRVHDLPDYVFFDHSAHVTRGVGCVECHGRVDTMVQVRQEKKLSMGWCLDCHRNPEDIIRPIDEVTNMTWEAEDQAALAEALTLARGRELNAPTNCSGCHR